MVSMLIATRHAVYVWQSPFVGQPDAVKIDHDATVLAITTHGNISLIAIDGRLLLRKGTTEAIFRHGLSELITALLVCDAEPLRTLIGTQGAHLYEFNEDYGTAVRVVSFDKLPCRARWHTPWGGPPAVRSLAMSSDRCTIYADIHVGSIMRSDDAGESWRPVNPGLDEDVHQVATCLAAPAHVYANTANAVYVSKNRGHRWAHRSTGLHARYGRAIAVHPDDPDFLLASVSNGPHGGDGRLYRSENTGRHWIHVTNGFPASREHNIDTFQIAFDRAGCAWAAADQFLYASSDRGQNWDAVWSAPEAIQLLACG